MPLVTQIKGRLAYPSGSAGLPDVCHLSDAMLQPRRNLRHHCLRRDAVAIVQRRQRARVEEGVGQGDLLETSQRTSYRVTTTPGAIEKIAPGVVVLITSELMSISLLTPAAQDRALARDSPNSLHNTSFIGRLDRKNADFFTLLLTIFVLAVTFRSDGLVFIVGRALATTIAAPRLTQ